MKYLNFEGLQYFYSKLSSSLSSKYVSQGNLKTINGQSLIGSGNISLLSNPVSGTFNVGGTVSNVPTINIKRDDTPYPAIILSEGGQGGLASIVIQHAGTGDLGTTITRDGISIAGKSSSDLLTAAGNTTSLKTINNQSLLGSGNITIEGGSISQQNENIIVSLGDDSLTINGENPKTIEFFYNNRLVTGLDLNDYLPLSGGTLTGNLTMTGMGDILFHDYENKLVGGIETDSDRAPINSRGNYSTIYCNYADNSSKGQLSPGLLSLTDRGEYIYVRPSGIEKTGGSPTGVFATDGSVVDMNTYLPLSGGELSGSLYITGGSQLQLIGIGGNLYFKDTENKIMAGIETQSDYSPVGGHGAYGTIYCRYTDDSSKSTLSPGGLSLTGNSGPVGEASGIYYSYSNISITMPGGRYRFNLQKLIDDGYLIEE